ncbi:39751_t:CDS:1, partial [Gigaspora margarita]
LICGCGFRHFGGFDCCITRVFAGHSRCHRFGVLVNMNFVSWVVCVVELPGFL